MKGHLLISGGCLGQKQGDPHADKRALDRLFQLAGNHAKVGIFNAAKESLNGSVHAIESAFHNYSEHTEYIPVSLANPEAADNPDIADKIRSKNVLYFIGGQQWRILDTFRPNGRDTHAYKAVRDVLNSGGIIAGDSAGAAMMSDPMIRGGNSHNALDSGASTQPDSGVRLTQGMTFLPYGLIDQHFLIRGRLGRLIVALAFAEKRLGFGIDENRSVIANLSTGHIETLGDHALLLVDIAKMHCNGKNWENIRISLLGDGDRVNGLSGEITVAKAKSPFVPTWENAVSPKSEPEVWAKNAILRMIHLVVQGKAKTAIGYDGKIKVCMTCDKDATLFMSKEAPTAVGLRLDILFDK